VMVMRVFRLRTGLRPTLGLDELIDLRPSETRNELLGEHEVLGFTTPLSSASVPSSHHQVCPS